MAAWECFSLTRIKSRSSAHGSAFVRAETAQTPTATQIASDQFFVIFWAPSSSQIHRVCRSACSRAAREPARESITQTECPGFTMPVYGPAKRRRSPEKAGVSRSPKDFAGDSRCSAPYNACVRVRTVMSQNRSVDVPSVDASEIRAQKDGRRAALLSGMFVAWVDHEHGLDPSLHVAAAAPMEWRRGSLFCQPKAAPLTREFERSHDL